MQLALKIQDLIIILSKAFLNSSNSEKAIQFKNLSEDDIMGKNAVKIDSAFEFDVSKDKLKYQNAGSMMAKKMVILICFNHLFYQII